MSASSSAPNGHSRRDGVLLISWWAGETDQPVIRVSSTVGDTQDETALVATREQLHDALDIWLARVADQ